MTTPSHAALKHAPKRRWIPAAGLLAMLEFAGLVVVTPQLRALAQEMLDLFTRVPQEEITSRELEAAANVPPVEAWQRELSLPEAERIAGFKLWQPSVVPEEHQFNQAACLPSEQMLISVYVAADDLVVDPRPYSQLVLAQQPATHVASSSNMYPIGASAAIETVQIGDVTGEYVEGVWCGANSDPKTPLQWCPSPSSRILRWQRGDWVFTLSALDDANSSRPSLTRQQMIELATNIVPSDE